ncbi:MAG: hypothetical protein ACIAQZ_13460 [Sedimentisphaeraceae bacterium JB056]
MEDKSLILDIGFMMSHCLRYLFCFLLCPALFAATVSVGDDGFAVVNGERRFVFGGYRDPCDQLMEFSNVSLANFVLTHDYYFESLLNENYTSSDVDDWISSAKDYLILAEEKGLAVFLGLPRWPVKLEDSAVIANIVNELKGCEALWFWYIDEPTLVLQSVDALANAYAVVKSNDDAHLLAITDTYERLSGESSYGNFCDIIWVDRYYLPYSPFEISNNIAKVRQLYPGKPVWAVPQVHDLQAVNQPKELTDPFPARMTLNDNNIDTIGKAIRAQVHGLLATEGVGGLVFYWGPKYWQDLLNETPQVWDSVKKIGLELKSLEQVLLSEEPDVDVKVSCRFSGANQRLSELYAGQLSEDDYPDNDQFKYWSRQYNGSIYVGISTTYVPLQVLKLEMPKGFEFARIVEYPSQQTVFSAGNDDDGDFYADRLSVTCLVVESGKSITLVLNDVDSVVLKFEPEFSSGQFSYTDNFSLPESLDVWVYYYGGAAISEDSLVTGSSFCSAVPDIVDNNLWSDYSLSCELKTSYSFSRQVASDERFFIGVSFRMVDELNYYLARIKKCSGSVYPSLVISKVVNGSITDLRSADIGSYMDTNSFYSLKVYCFGSNLTARLYYEGELLAEIFDIDADYVSGAAGINSLMPSGQSCSYDNFEVSGVSYNTDYLCYHAKSLGYSQLGDINGDCYVGLADFSILAEYWLACYDGQMSGCYEHLQYLAR